MTCERKDGGPAYPTGRTTTPAGDLVPDFEGMTLRDHAIIEFTKGLLANEGITLAAIKSANGDGDRAFREILASGTYVANAMLKARAK